MTNALRRKTKVARELLEALKELRSSVIPLIYRDMIWDQPTVEETRKAMEAMNKADEAISKAEGME